MSNRTLKCMAVSLALHLGTRETALEVNPKDMGNLIKIGKR